MPNVRITLIIILTGILLILAQLPSSNRVFADFANDTDQKLDAAARVTNPMESSKQLNILTQQNLSIFPAKLTYGNADTTAVSDPMFYQPYGFSTATSGANRSSKVNANGSLEELKRILKEMNLLLDEAIADSKLPPLQRMDDEDLRKLLYKLVKLKVQAMSELPTVYWRPFVDWYGDFSWLDKLLFRAASDAANPFASEGAVIQHLQDAKKSQRRS